MRFALLFVGVQKPRAQLAVQDGRELPAQIEGVAHAAVHSLAGEGRRQVRRVAGEEHAARAPVLCDARMECVHDLAHDLQIAVAGRAFADEPAHDILAQQVLVALARVDHDLISTRAVRPGKRYGGASRIAEHAGMPEPVGSAHEIDDQPALVEGRALQHDA